MLKIQSPSPNFSENSTRKTTVVLHKTLGLMPGCLDWMENPQSQVSAHYLVTKKGEVYQLIDTRKVAWHAGRVYNPSNRAKNIMQKTSWGSYVNPNKYCIGIENEALINDKITGKQLEANILLIKDIIRDTYNDFDGDPDHIITHRDITSYKPNLELLRDAVIDGLQETPSNSNLLILDSWDQLKIEVKDKKIILYKK